MFDHKLCWKPHIRHICTKLSKGCWAKINIQNYVDMQTLKIVYDSLVYSHLNYCISIWDMASHNALDPLIKLHKRILKIITKSPPLTPTLPLFKKLNFLKIEEMYKFEIAKNVSA